MILPNLNDKKQKSQKIIDKYKKITIIENE